VIVDIDEKSLQVEGRWPWSREKVSKLTDGLFAREAAVVAFDIIFAEPEENAAQKLLDRVGANKPLTAALSVLVPEMDYDQRFAQALTDRDVVLGYAFHNEALDPAGQLPAALAASNPGALTHAPIKTMRSYTANLPVLQQAARHAGFLNAEIDADGVLRRSALILRHDDKLFPSLALQVARVFYGIEKLDIQTVPADKLAAISSVRLGRYDIPTDSAGRVLVPYRGAYPNYPYISATDVLKGAVPDELLQSAIVLVGTTAPGLNDLHATPIFNSYPGVEIHANIIAGLLDSHFPVQPLWADRANFYTLLALSLLLVLLLPLLSPVRLVLVTLSIAAMLILVNLWLWTAYGYALNIATPLILVLLLAVMNTVYGFASESQERSQLKGMFGQYVPQELVEAMSRNPQNFGFDGDSREMSVLFADIRNFTTISETLSANDLKRLLNEFFTAMTEIIFRQQGTIDKYVGDMLMAFWGAPLANPRHPGQAIEAALDMLSTIEQLNPRLKIMGLPEISIGIGVNSGTMNVGNMGSEFRRAYTVIGDAVNLASRLEGLTKFYGVSLIVGEATQKNQDNFIFRRLDAVKVKGKTQAVMLYEPLCRQMDVTPALLDELALHEKALTYYFDRQWDMAKELFNELHGNQPDTRLYNLYLERLDELQHLSADMEWDGSYEHKHK
jgi:adenylate cyclase